MRLTKDYWLLCFIWIVNSSYVLDAGKRFLKREAQVFMRHVEQAFAAETPDVKVDTLEALQRFFSGIVLGPDRTREIHIYTLAHVIRSWPDGSSLPVFHQGTVAEYFPSAALQLLRQVDFDLLSVNRIVGEENGALSWQG